ncbi:hypothetical protein [Streptomyces subrutilus]|uniref:hypothetical protein n=1 Tax=Streptomyces subrutilus TaxID=36818 RepID=UPI00340D3B7B
MGIEDGLEEAATKASKQVPLNEVGDKKGDGKGANEKESEADDVFVDTEKFNDDDE